MRYHRPGVANIVVYKPPTDVHPRFWYSVDRSRSLGMTCHAIRTGLIRFFEYDYQSAEVPGLLHDFLALQEEKSENRGLTDVYYITKNPSLADDFAQSVNIGSAALWYLTDSWPDFAAASKFEISNDLMALIDPPGKIDWPDL